MHFYKICFDVDNKEENQTEKLKSLFFNNYIKFQIPLSSRSFRNSFDHGSFIITTDDELVNSIDFSTKEIVGNNEPTKNKKPKKFKSKDYDFPKLYKYKEQKYFELNKELNENNLINTKLKKFLEEKKNLTKLNSQENENLYLPKKRNLKNSSLGNHLNKDFHKFSPENLSINSEDR